MSDTDAKTTESTDIKTEAPAEEPAVTAESATPVEAAEKPQEENLFDQDKLNILNDVSILLTIEIGRAQIKIRDLLNLSKGSVLELNKLAGDPVDVYANGKLVSIG